MVPPNPTPALPQLDRMQTMPHGSTRAAPRPYPELLLESSHAAWCDLLWTALAAVPSSYWALPLGFSIVSGGRSLGSAHATNPPGCA